MVSRSGRHFSHHIRRLSVRFLGEEGVRGMGRLKFAGAFGGGVAVTLMAIVVLASLHVAFYEQAEQGFGFYGGPMGVGQFKAAAPDGQTYWEESAHNILTSVGYTWFINQTANGATSAPTPTNTTGIEYLQLSSNSTTPNGSETTCQGSYSSNGLSAIQGTYANVNSTAYNITGSWSSITGSGSIYRLCYYNGPPTTWGVLLGMVEWNNPATVAAGDTFAGNFTVDLSGP